MLVKVSTEGRVNRELLTRDHEPDVEACRLREGKSAFTAEGKLGK